MTSPVPILDYTGNGEVAPSLSRPVMLIGFLAQTNLGMGT